MMKFRWTISRKLWVLSGLAGVLMLVLAVSALNFINSLGNAITDVTRTAHMVRSHLTADMMHDALRSDVLSALLSATKHQKKTSSRVAPVGADGEATENAPVMARAPDRDAIEGDLADHATIFREELSANLTRAQNPRIVAALRKVGPALQDFISGAEELVDLAYRDLDEANAKLDDFLDLFDRLAVEMEAVSDLIASQADEREAMVDEQISQAMWVMSSILVVSLIAMAVIGGVIARGIVGPVQQAAAIAHRIAEGDLDQRIDISTSDETSEMLASLQEMCDRIGAIVRQVRDAAHTVSGASREVASGSLDLSQRIEEMAATLEETTSTMQDIAGTVAGNAELARQAGGIAGEASTRTNSSMEVVGRTSGAMDEAERASQRIEEIIGTIDGIAFQTNLLALNAAVEAARAGEQGRGFAVVAQEVRSLAQRCAEAAGEVKKLVADNVDKVRQGSSLAQESGQRLHDTADAIAELTKMVREVASSSGDQASGVDQVNRAVVQMDSVTQQNAALVEELASASATMDDKARELIDAVNYFKLSDSASFVAPRAVGSRRRAPDVRRLPSA